MKNTINSVVACMVLLVSNVFAQDGTVVINKVVIGGDDTFAYTSSPGLGSLGTGFNIAATAISGGTTGDIVNLTPGTYTVQETDPQVSPGGWDFTSLTCSDPGDNGSSVNLTTRTATIDLDPGETVSCIFTNTKSGSITVIKTTQGGDGTFAFGGIGPDAFDFGGGFDITTIGGTSDPGNNAVFSNLAPGLYGLVEVVPSGWDLESATCSGDDDGSDPASISLDAGETVICTFTNTKRGSIEIVKSLSATGPVVETFTFDAGGAFRFDGVGGSVFQTTLTGDGDTTGPIEVLPGLSYSVTESDPTAGGWGLIDASCDDGSNPGSAIDISPGEAVVCTFTNAPLGSVTIVKNAIGGDDTFNFEWLNNVPEGESSTFQLTTTSGAASRDFTFQLLPGVSYDVTELVPTGWDLTNIDCSEDADQNTTWSLETATATLRAEAGETLTCTFTNTIRPAPNSDDDGDSVLDVDDNCANTIIPESIPTRALGVNRFALVDSDGEFDTTTPKGKGPRRSYTIADTAGCSCTQIIEAQGLGKGHTKFGCSISAMDDWLMLVN